MATTTKAAIRTAMLGVVDGITPAVEALTKFIPWREDDDIRPWAEKNKAACARRVSIRFLGSTEAPAVNDTLVQEVQDIAEIVICYPKGNRFGRSGALDLDDVIESDARLIEARIGPPGYATFAGLVAPCAVLWEQANEIEQGAGVVFSVLRYRVDYFRSLS